MPCPSHCRLLVIFAQLPLDSTLVLVNLCQYRRNRQTNARYYITCLLRRQSGYVTVDIMCIVEEDFSKTVDQSADASKLSFTTSPSLNVCSQFRFMFPIKIEMGFGDGWSFIFTSSTDLNVTFNKDVWVIHSSVMDISTKRVGGVTQNFDKGRRYQLIQITATYRNLSR